MKCGSENAGIKMLRWNLMEALMAFTEALKHEPFLSFFPDKVAIIWAFLDPEILEGLKRLGPACTSSGLSWHAARPGSPAWLWRLRLCWMCNSKINPWRVEMRFGTLAAQWDGLVTVVGVQQSGPAARPQITKHNQTVVRNSQCGKLQTVVTCAKRASVGRMLRTRPVHLKPLVDAAEQRQKDRSGVNLRTSASEQHQRDPAAWIPFMVDAEAGQAGDGVSLQQLVQADGTFTRVLRQDVL